MIEGGNIGAAFGRVRSVQFAVRVASRNVAIAWSVDLSIVIVATILRFRTAHLDDSLSSLYYARIE